MDDRYRLGRLENDALLAGLSLLVRRENDALSDLLAHLAEIDQRGLCIALGYSSLFAYCCEALGFCKSSAGRRIAAARVCRKYPEAFERVAGGELQLCVLSALGRYLSAENATELFGACSGKSYDQVEELLAVRFPRADVRDLVRRLPVRVATHTPNVGSGTDKSLKTSPSAPLGRPEPSVLSAFRQEQQLTPIRPASSLAALVPAAERGTVKPIAEDRFGVHFTADSEFRELLEEVRALASHGQDSGSLMSLMKRGLRALRSELLKKRFGVGRKPRRVLARPRQGVAQKRSRAVPAAVAREVYERDGGRCTFCSDEGRRCGTRELLQIDHITAHADGGEATADNLRLRCRAHNLHAAELRFGTEYVRKEVARAQAGKRVQSEKCAGSSRPGEGAGRGAREARAREARAREARARGVLRGISLANPRG